MTIHPTSNVCSDTTDPNFETTLRIKYFQGRKQQLRVQVYRCKPDTAVLSTTGELAKFDLYGEDECELKDIIAAPGRSICDPLATSGGTPAAGVVMVRTFVLVTPLQHIQ
jgi:hypothetical protein